MTDTIRATPVQRSIQAVADLRNSHSCAWEWRVGLGRDVRVTFRLGTEDVRDRAATVIRRDMEKGEDGQKIRVEMGIIVAYFSVC